MCSVGQQAHKSGRRVRVADRLTAQARVEGLRHDGRPIALFLYAHSAGRNQIAPGLFTRLAGDRAIGWSGGSEPGFEINAAAATAMPNAA
jgi:hypothetical protein